MNEKKEQKKRDWRETLIGIGLPQIIAGVFGLLILVLGFCLNNSDTREGCELVDRIEKNMYKIEIKIKNEADEDQILIFSAYHENLNNFLNSEDICGDSNLYIKEEVQEIENRLNL